ncbi:ADP-ribosylglycohydrolase family protein, partial [Staphylococcus epidermidis]|uniref:ADP-ribosylglycohydrolase family protein n=1 Tax=Staphylococcus epidermidis TaxID=1282 RepID=UPI0030BBC662
ANHFESEEEYSLWLYDVIGCGTSLTESVPTALAIAYFCKDPNKCAIFCANIGGDTDKIGAMATAISGAKYGYSNFKKLWIENID